MSKAPPAPPAKFVEQGPRPVTTPAPASSSSSSSSKSSSSRGGKSKDNGKEKKTEKTKKDKVQKAEIRDGPNGHPAAPPPKRLRKNDDDDDDDDDAGRSTSTTTTPPAAASLYTPGFHSDAECQPDAQAVTVINDDTDDDSGGENAPASTSTTATISAPDVTSSREKEAGAALVALTSDPKLKTEFEAKVVKAIGDVVVQSGRLGKKEVAELGPMRARMPLLSKAIPATDAMVMKYQYSHLKTAMYAMDYIDLALQQQREVKAPAACATCADLRNSQQAAHERAKDAAAKAKSLKGELDAANKALAKLTDDLESATQETKGWTKATRDVNEKLKAKTAEAADLKAQLDKAKEVGKRDDKGKEKVVDPEPEPMSQEIGEPPQDLLTVIRNMTPVMDNLIGRLGIVKADFDAEAEKQESAKKTIADLECKLKAAQQAVRNLEAEHNRLLGVHQALNDESKKLLTEFSAMKSLHAQLSDASKTHTADLENARLSYRSLETTLATCEKDRDKFDQLYRSAQLELVEEKDQVVKRNNTIQELRSKLHDCETRSRDKANELKDAMAARSQSDAMVKVLKEEVGALETQALASNAAHEKQLKDILASSATDDARLKELQAGLDRYRAEAARELTAAKDARARLDDKSKALEDLKVAFAADRQQSLQTCKEWSDRVQELGTKYSQLAHENASNASIAAANKTGLELFKQKHDDLLAKAQSKYDAKAAECTKNKTDRDSAVAYALKYMQSCAAMRAPIAECVDVIGLPLTPETLQKLKGCIDAAKSAVDEFDRSTAAGTTSSSSSAAAPPPRTN